MRLDNVSNMVRSEVVPYYIDLIISNASDNEVIRVNKLILSKWSNSGLLYIKDKAHSAVLSMVKDGSLRVKK